MLRDVPTITGSVGRITDAANAANAVGEMMGNVGLSRLLSKGSRTKVPQQREMMTARARGGCSIAHTGPR